MHCEPIADCFNSLLHGFLDFAATEATSTDSNPLVSAFDDCTHGLQIWIKGPLRLIIGVTDVMAGLATFATEIACKCHGYTPSSSLIDARSQRSECTTGPFVLTSRFDGVDRLSMGASGLRKGNIR